MKIDWCPGFGAATLLALFGATPAVAQRADDNAIKSASDAFGTSIGAETIGLYSATEVRGFSPIAAGNLRLDGLYFDQLEFLNPRLFESRVVRVGPSAQGYPFPAPTGIVDHYLRKTGNKAIVSVVADAHSFGAVGMDVDAQLPVSERLGLAGGVSYRRDPDYPGGDYVNIFTVGAIARWLPHEGVELQGFAGRIANRDDRTTPYIFAAGPELPSVKGRRFIGQKWAYWDANLDNFGLTGQARLGGWILRGGVFRHVIDIPRSFNVLFLDASPAGDARLVVNSDPAQQWTYNSGELRLSRTFQALDWRHTIHFSVRGGQRRRSYGGGDSVDLGIVPIADPPEFPEPEFSFGPQTHDEAKQLVGGIAYHGQWAGRGEFGIGLQRERYRKSVRPPSVPAVESRADPWLWNASLAINLTDRLTAYGGYIKGLEESEVAPDNATNRSESPPPLRTSQRDFGLVLKLPPDLRFILGAFDVRKPYFNVDQTGFFRNLGEVRNRGLELSINGTPLPGLSVVAGAVFLRPEISGEAVDNGIIGSRPVGQARHIARLNLDYRPPSLRQVSVDLGVNNSGRRFVSGDNQLSEPGKTVLDVGARHYFNFGRSPATLRLLIANVTNVSGWNVASSGGLRPVTPRRATLSLTVDFTR